MHWPIWSSICLVLVLFATLMSALPTRLNQNDRTLSSSSSSSFAVRHRRSGYSDQRLAELETIFALADMADENHRRLMNTPQVGYGVVDFHKIGKRKRSFDELASEDSEPRQVAEVSSVLLDRVLRRLRSLSATSNHVEHEDDSYRNPRLLSSR